MKIPEQFEIEDKKYSIIGVYSLIEFLHKFIDGEFPGMSAYIIIDKDKPNKPLLPEFYNKIVNEMGTLYRYYNEDKIAVAAYEVAPVIKHPSRMCGNCREYVKHYGSCDSLLGIFELQEGHCDIGYRALKRNRYDRPKDDRCFCWNAECLAILEHLKKGGGQNAQ